MRGFSWPPAIFAPLRHRTYAMIWMTMVVANTGMWMQEVASGWILSGMTDSAVLVALLQTCVTLPIFLFALPGGAIGDRFNRRILLIIVQSLLALAAVTLAFLTLFDRLTPFVILGFAFLAGSGIALAAPARQAITPALVPREDLSGAITLNAIGFNGARALGPALGGALIAMLGYAAPFFVNALAYCASVAVLVAWRHEQPRRPVQGSLIGDAGRGVKLVWQAPMLRTIVVRAVGFFLFACAGWALMPLVGRAVSGDASIGYGLLVTAIGLGAVIGGFLLPEMRRRFGPELTVQAGAGLVVAALFLLGGLWSYPVTLLAFALFGAGWIMALATLNTTLQMIAPDSHRGRVLSIYMLVFAASMAIGSLLWGAVAGMIGLGPTLWLTSALLAVSAMLGRAARIDESVAVPSPDEEVIPAAE